MKYSISIEKWAVKADKPTTRVTIRKIVVRDQFGRFNGATNYRGSVL